jgi:hypothetical protein
VREKGGGEEIHGAELIAEEGTCRSVGGVYVDKLMKRYAYVCEAGVMAGKNKDI